MNIKTWLGLGKKKQSMFDDAYWAKLYEAERKWLDVKKIENNAAFFRAFDELVAECPDVKERRVCDFEYETSRRLLLALQKDLSK